MFALCIIYTIRVTLWRPGVPYLRTSSLTVCAPASVWPAVVVVEEAPADVGELAAGMSRGCAIGCCWVPVVGAGIRRGCCESGPWTGTCCGLVRRLVDHLCLSSLLNLKMAVLAALLVARRGILVKYVSKPSFWMVINFLVNSPTVFPGLTRHLARFMWKSSHNGLSARKDRPIFWSRNLL